MVVIMGEMPVDRENAQHQEEEHKARASAIIFQYQIRLPNLDTPLNSLPTATGLPAERQYLHALLGHLPQAICILDATLRLQYWNPGLVALLGLQDGDLHSGLPFSERLQELAAAGRFGTGDTAALIRQLTPTPGELPPVARECTLANGRSYLIEHLPQLAQGRPAGIVSIYTDLSEQRANANREHLAQKVFTHTPVGIVLTDREHRIDSINPACIQLTGFEGFELVGHTVFALLDTTTAQDVERLERTIAERGSWQGELEFIRKSGQSLSADVRINVVDAQSDNQGGHYIWIIADITERKQAEARMRHIAQHDPLTGLPNRLSLLNRLGQLLPEARRHNFKAAVMFLDLDRFKVINDTLGHQVGDELLREVASRLSAVVRKTDFVARLGGDEFVILLPDVRMPTDAALVAGKIVAALAEPVGADGNELHTSPSIGISIFPDDGADGDTLLKNADTAMYHAKAAGRNNYQFFANEMNQAAAQRLDIERKLRHAIARNEFALVFQPQFSAGSRQPTGVEALVRWHHPSDGIIPPDRFIPVAEETGLIVDIGDWVLRNACREMKHWQDAGLQPLRIAVNVSARQLRRRDFCDAVAGALAETGLPAELLELEITESAVMEDPEEAVALLQRLGRMGLTLAIDDFGTGYSSLAYLKLFPIDHLKIDRSFVRDIEHDLNDRAIAFSTIALAHSLGLNVIAEGVETEDQLELLRSNGCDEVQGYLFSKPLSSAAAFAFLHRNE